MQVKFKFASTYKQTAPLVKISTNTDSVEATLTDASHTIECELDITNNDQLSVEFVNKDDADNNIVEIQELHVDGINLQHFILEGVYTPVYNSNWYAEQDPKPPAQFSPGTTMHHAGVWKYPIRLPVWKDIMDRWLKDERHGNT